MLTEDGKHLYVINELKNTVTVFDYTTGSGTLAGFMSP